MKKVKFLSYLLVFVLVFALAGCGGETGGGSEDPDPDDDQPKVLVYSDGTELKLGVCHNSNATSISFKDAAIVGSGLLLTDGKTYQLGDLKPTWAALEDILSVEFNDVYTGKTSAQKEYIEWKAKDFEGVDVVVGNADDMSEDGKTGLIVDLSQWLDYMPNFKQFLEENPIVYLSVVSDTEKGSIYYAPYFDGFDDIEKYFLMRTDWVEALLDGEGAYSATASDTFGDICGTAAYTPYMPTEGSVVVKSLNANGVGTQDITKNFGTSFGNIAAYMNANVTAETTGVQLVQMLRDYIDAAYNGLYGNERSRLFVGHDAAWDADELVALLRCIVTNTQKLTGQNVTKVTGIFPREKDLNRTSDLFSLVSMFGVRGYESRADYLYFDAEGNLCDARADQEYVEGINKLNQLYKEGLIMQDFDTYSGKIYDVMYTQNQGFMIYDYCQTQCLYNNNEAAVASAAAAGTVFNLSPVMNPVAKWFDGSAADGVWMRFTESWRSVKTSGWCIPTTCTGEKLQAALALFDYMYSDAGALLMSYGPEAWRSGNTTLYKGEQIPELSAGALDELWRLGKGNYTNYARQFLGSTLPIGFVKSQGMEYQCTTEGGKGGASLVSAAIAAGTIKHVTPFISENLFYTMVPTTLPTTAVQDTTLKQYAAIGSDGLYSKTKGKYSIYVDVIKNGFGSGDTLSKTTFLSEMPADAAALIAYHKTNGGDVYASYKALAWNKILNFYNNNLK